MVKVKSAKGKSKKITWKKIKHTDVDDFLVDKRRDERLGLSEKPDEELFQIDQLGFDDNYAQLAQKKRDAASKRFSRQKDGPLVVLEDLKCFKILKPDSAVKDPVIKRNPVLKGGLKKTLDMKLKDEIRYYRQRETRSSTKDSTSSEMVDLWATTGISPVVNTVLDNEWLTAETKRNILRNRSNWKPTLQKNEIAAVEVPHPGLSYNPSFVHHQQLLVSAVENVKAKLKQEKKIARATATPKFEGDGTLPDFKDEPKEEDSDVDDKSTLKKFTKPKTKQQKRKEKEQREKEMKLKEQKEKTKKEVEVFRVKTLTKQIKLAEAKSKARLDNKVSKKLNRERFGVRTLSKFKFEDKETQPLLSDELPKGLLGAGGSVATGDLLLDRFKSLQKRNVIEPRMKHKQKLKNKPKTYIRDCDKMEWEKTGIWNGEKLSLPSGRRRPQVPRKKKRNNKFNK